MSPARIVAGLLTQGSGAPCSAPSAGLSWPVYVGWMPDTPPAPTLLGIVAVHDTGGMHWPRSLDLGPEEDMYSVQIEVRGQDYSTTWAQAALIAQWLEDARDVVVTGDNSGDVVTVRAFRRSSTLTFAGYDAQRTVTVTLNGYILWV